MRAQVTWDGYLANLASCLLIPHRFSAQLLPLSKAKCLPFLLDPSPFSVYLFPSLCVLLFNRNGCQSSLQNQKLIHNVSLHDDRSRVPATFNSFLWLLLLQGGSGKSNAWGDNDWTGLSLRVCGA